MSDLTTEDIEEIVTESTSGLRERVDDLEDELADERERRREAEQRVEELEERVESEEDERERLAREAAKDRARLAAVEEQIESTAAVEEDDLGNEDLTPMEQIAQLPEHVAVEQFDNENHRNTYRARSIIRDWSDYSETTPAGRLLWNRDLCRILTAQEDGRVESTTGQRVMERIETLSKGAWSHEQRKGEHVLLLAEPEKLATAESDAVVS